MHKEKMTVAYVRLSSKELEKKNTYSTSIYNQINIIKEYAKRMRFNIDKEYIDDGYSGVNFERPDFEDLLNDIEKGLIDTIITKDMSRLGRDFISTVYYISEYFPKHKIRYIAIDDNFDSSNLNEFQKLIFPEIKSIINSQHAKDTSIKRKQVAMSKTNNGEFIGFIAPYGYKIVKKDNKRTLEIDGNAACIVKRIFSNIAAGKSRIEVAEELNNDKIPPPVIYMNITHSKNKKYYCDWTDKVIYRIIKNKTYIGSIVKRKSEKKDYRQKKRIWIPIKDRQTIDNAHPAIISVELFEEANSKLRKLKKKKQNHYDGTLRDIVICGECGNKMTACRKTKKERDIYYFACNKIIDRKKCNNRTIYDSKLKIIIKDNIKDIVNTYVDSEEITDAVAKEFSQKRRNNLKIQNIESAIKLCNNKIKNIYLKKTNSEISVDEFIVEKNSILNERDKLEKNLKLINDGIDSESMKEEITNAYDKFIKEDIFLKDYIKKIIDKIIIYKDNTVKIVFKFGVGKSKNIKLY